MCLMHVAKTESAASSLLRPVSGLRCTQRRPFREDDTAMRPASSTPPASALVSLSARPRMPIFMVHKSPRCAFSPSMVRISVPKWRLPASLRADFARRTRCFYTASGTSARDYTYIDDIIDGIIAAIDRTADSQLGFRAYNLGGERTTAG